MTLLRNDQKLGIWFKGNYSLLVYIGLTLLLTDGVRHRDSEDEFHITTFFRVRFARDKLLSTLVELLFAIQIMLSVQKIPS